MNRCLKGRNFLYILLPWLLAGWSCKDQPRHRSDDYAAMPLYCDYRISGDDESGHVTVLMQFRAGGPDGPGMLLEKPAAVLFDGYELTPDSSRNHGVYYEQRWLASEFNGHHEVAFITGGGDTLRETFRYPVFGFAQPVPPKMAVADLEIELTGLPANDSLHILLLDTSYRNAGIDRYIRLQNNKILLSTDDFSRLEKGPVLFDIYRDEERELGETYEAGGRLALSYALHSRFLLE